MRDEKEMLDKIAAQVNKIAAGLGWYSVSPRFRYWRVKKDKYAFGWTTEKDREGKFYAFIYRILRDKWKMAKKVAFGKRFKAKKRALKWYHARQEKLSAAEKVRNQ